MAERRFSGEVTLTNTHTTKENGTIIFLEQFEESMKLEELRLECNAIFQKRTSS
jgi:hypothetical protein